jgi:periplasmic mercuric ion binding protein
MRTLKSTTFYFFTLILFLSISTNVNAQTKGKNSNIQSIQIKTSAVCDMCKETIEKALSYETGVKKSNLDVKTKICTVQFDITKTTPEKIKLAISNSGYDADAVKANKKAYDKLSPCCKAGNASH